MALLEFLFIPPWAYQFMIETSESDELKHIIQTMRDEGVNKEGADTDGSLLTEAGDDQQGIDLSKRSLSESGLVSFDDL